MRWCSQQSLPPLQGRPRSKLKFWQRDQEKWRAWYIELSPGWLSGDLVGLGFLDQWDCLEEPHGRSCDQVCLSGFLTITISGKDTSWVRPFISPHASRAKKQSLLSIEAAYCPTHFSWYYRGRKLRRTQHTGPFCRSFSCSGDCCGVACATGVVWTQSCCWLLWTVPP